MKVLFINPVPPRCGVHQYGLRLYSILIESVRLQAQYSTTDTCDSMGIPDVVVYNWHPIIDPPCEVIQRPHFALSKKVIIYHDGTVPAPHDAIIFSWPGHPQDRTNWHYIGRPLPEWIPTSPPGDGRLTVGIAGFCGAWAADAVRHVISEYDSIRFRLLLPHSDWCDANGDSARASARECSLLLRTGDVLEVEHEFLSEQGMLEWLSGNHVNCYIRSSSPSVGISSATDNALAVRRPIAINRNQMFRHLFNTNPSICIEDTSLRAIVRNGVAPLIPIYQRNDRKVVMAELEEVLLSL